MQAKGTLGLIATNTVAQGDTREVGLDAMVADGFTITRAIQSRPWPAASANLEYAAVWGTVGRVPDDLPRIADDIPVARISTLLEPTGRVTGMPTRLTENAGIAFIGCNVNGKGFEVPPSIAQEMIGEDVQNSEVLRPFLGGEDVNQVPDLCAPMWVVDFYPRELDEARIYSAPIAWLEKNVRPHREGLKNKPKLGERWWRYERDAVAMRAATKSLREVLVIALVSKTVMTVRVPTGQVFSHALAVFATADYGDQAVLSSSLHQLWAITYGSTLETRVRYAPSDVFETFPLPTSTGRLSAAGRELDVARREVMLRRNLGLTKLYNLVDDEAVANDPDVERLRQIHVEIDEAATEAYGWGDLHLDHGFHIFRQVKRWSVGGTARVALLDRLLLENQRRASANGLFPAVPSPHETTVPDRSGTLFD
ncbi:type IIL restriction-modification enzyme MmeI [Microbacterium arborescens]|uniref:type IIL restriction-modification enzyme MmeI n=1 Tax=Microbacterium arborescens TaxID=33883 RepID=UPI002780D021|nr:type IIL restriction-modification enzyme MmeI [Microbacterium arborescens]MDQ1215813.1 hypothetical protein [Microbacterium arborescens]